MNIRKIIKEEIDKVFKKRNLLVLIGPPSVGKSHWISEKFKGNNYIVINRDEIVDGLASSIGITYDDIFEFPPKNAKIGELVPGRESLGVVISSGEHLKKRTEFEYQNIRDLNNEVARRLESKFKEAVNSDKDILIDMTNMSVMARRNIFMKINGRESEFNKIAVVFNFKDSDIVDVIKKLATRRGEEIKANGGSKTITPDIIDVIISNYEPPTREEGFDEIIDVDNSSELKNALTKKQERF